MYAIEFAGRRRPQPPREDLTTLILEPSSPAPPMSDVDFGSFFVQLVTAGNSTTKTMLSPLHPSCSTPISWPSCGPIVLSPGPSRSPAVGQPAPLLPPHGDGRHRAPRRRDRGGRQGGDVLHVGQPRRGRVRRPRAFDIRRHPNPHLSFGIAEHDRLGVHLARLEGRRSSMSSSPPTRRSSSWATLSVPARTSTTPSSTYRSGRLGPPEGLPAGVDYHSDVAVGVDVLNRCVRLEAEVLPEQRRQAPSTRWPGSRRSRS